MGAPYDDVVVGANTITDVGAAYIFTWSGTSWSEQQKIQSSDKQSGDRFGNSVAISENGNTAIVGAYAEGFASGAAYIFTRSGTSSSWSEQQKIRALDWASYDLFGSSVAISGDGDTTIIGARVEDTGGTDAGAAYIYQYNF